MKADKILFPSITWWLLILLPFVLIGFYPTYFSKIFSPAPGIIHVHTIFMSLWVIMAILQPYLIKRKKIRLHRYVGKLSYLLMPLVVITGWMVIKHSYHNSINSRILKEGNEILPDKYASIINAANENVIIGIVYLFWLTLFYSLAVINRKRIVYHASFMFAAILTLLGPTLDRVLFQVYQYYSIGFNLFAEIAVFLLIDILLIGLLWYQHKSGYPVNATFAALLIYITGQFAYFSLPQTLIWKRFVEFIM